MGMRFGERDWERDLILERTMGKQIRSENEQSSEKPESAVKLGC